MLYTSRAVMLASSRDASVSNVSERSAQRRAPDRPASRVESFGAGGAGEEQAGVLTRTAFKELFHAEYERLFRRARRYTGSSEAAEEVVQDVFFELWERRASLKAEPSALTAYLMKAVRHRALDHLARQHIAQEWEEEETARQRAKARRAAAGSELRGPHEDLVGQELQEEARRAIDALPERQREVFLLSRRRGLTYREIASVLGIAYKTVETHMDRAFTALREALEDHLPDAYR